MPSSFANVFVLSSLPRVIWPLGGWWFFACANFAGLTLEQINLLIEKPTRKLIFFLRRVNLQLLASCYMQNNQAYSACHILKGMQTTQSRNLFVMPCFQMDLLNEAETVLCSANDPGGEIPNGAAGHYLLGLICWYTDRKKSVIHHFRLSLSMDLLLWAAYEELCILGASEEATVVFREAAALCIQKQYLYHGLASPNLHASNAS
ncbi:hypothetical protein HRI_005244900 [Hibiscus trionum]|uniref:Uncharacterized protein n=1 Tax=Hibiscus trionum TaxID=183268 RepID=A0A9W7JI00_HIBTR|nr:hypothetical protein HRI_005244900 [Hibiscus trionum]